MPVTPITPPQIDEVGKGACLTAPDHSAKPEPEDGLGPTGECSSRGPAPGDLLYRSEWETSRDISHAEAREIARRLIASHFRRTDTETARVGIPARPDYDDDLLINSYIKQQARKDAFAAANPSGQVYELGPLDPKPLGLAFGCCSATSPCEHQKRDPMTLCTTCERSWQRARAAHVERIFGAASCDEQSKTEDRNSGLSPKDASAVGEAETPEVTPSIPPSPRKGQEENPCPMTVEEAAAQACYAVTVEAVRPSFKKWPGGWKPEDWDELKEIERELHRNYARAALSTIRASEEDR